jgi:hypothetical protein
MNIGDKYSNEITVLSVDIKNAFKHPSISYNDKKYGCNSITSRKTDVKCLLVNFIDDKGNKGYFYTSSVEILIVDGFLSYKYLLKKSPWFHEVKGETIGHNNILAYKGGLEPNVIIENTSQILPSVNVGDIIKITANVKKITESGLINLFRVKRIS